MPFDSARRLRVRSHLHFLAARLRPPSRHPPAARPGLPLPFQPKSNGTVVDQGNLHVGAEHAAFDPWLPGAGRRDEPLEQAPPQIR